MISLATTTINNKVYKNVQDCLDKGIIGQGKYIEEFEDKVAKYVGVKHAIAVSSGSMADIIALAVLKELEPTKREVIVPAFTFIAHIQAVLVNGLKPIFVDIDYDYQIQTETVWNKINNITLAIMPANLMGKRCNVKTLSAYQIPVLEDSCETFGIKPQQIGTYSFYPSHTITTGEGGMIVTDNDEYSELARKIRNHGRKSNKIEERFKFDVIGFNGKMNNISASIGVAAIDETDSIIKKRKENIIKLNKLINSDFEADSPHAYPIMCKSEKERDKKLKDLTKAEVESRKFFSCLPTQELAFRYSGHKLGDFPIAEDIGNRGLYVPIHQDLTYEQIKTIANIIKDWDW